MLLSSQLIDESDAAMQPMPSTTVLEIKPLHYKTILAQAAKVASPNNSYQTQGEVGSLGKYQFNSANLELLGYIKRGSVDEQTGLAGANMRAINKEANWTNKNGCSSASAFLSNPGEQEQAIQDLWNYNTNWFTANTSFFAKYSLSQQVGLLLVAQIAGVQNAANFNDYLLGKNPNANLRDYTLQFTLYDYYQAGILASDFGLSIQLA